MAGTGRVRIWLALVFIDTPDPGRVPAFEEVEDDVRQAWLAARRRSLGRKHIRTCARNTRSDCPLRPGHVGKRSRIARGPPVKRSWRRFGLKSPWLLLALLLVPCAASAHESRPAYLAVTETAPGLYSLLWRTPLLAHMRLPVIVKLPDRVKNLKEPVVSELADSLVERRWVDAGPNGLAGERVEFMGLQLTITDVLVRVQMLNGTVSTALARPNQPWVEIAAEPGYCRWRRLHLARDRAYSFRI